MIMQYAEISLIVYYAAQAVHRVRLRDRHRLAGGELSVQLGQLRRAPGEVRVARRQVPDRRQRGRRRCLSARRRGVGGVGRAA